MAKTSNFGDIVYNLLILTQTRHLWKEQFHSLIGAHELVQYGPHGTDCEIYKDKRFPKMDDNWVREIFSRLYHCKKRMNIDSFFIRVHYYACFFWCILKALIILLSLKINRNVSSCV